MTTIAHSLLAEIVAERLAKARRPLQSSAEGVLQGILQTLKVEARTLTLLCAEDPNCTRGRDLAVMAHYHQGWIDRFTTASALAVFSSATDALEMAMEMQRDANRCKVTLVTGSCIVATFLLDGRTTRMVFGSGVAHAEELVNQVASGTIHVSPETYPLLQNQFEATNFGGLLFAEFAGEDLLEASITMPPEDCSNLSTFAGLGLTHGRATF